MSTEQTMELNGLQLRRSDEFWQYLSEGVGLDPDTWCDASSVLSPFGGSGVNVLLDELAATKAREEELVDGLLTIRGKGSCCDAWDLIEELVSCEGF